MDENTFWQLIESNLDRDSLNSLGEDDYPDEIVQPLIDQLAELSVEEIEHFEEVLSKALYDIDGEVFADNAGESGQSGDGFLYCRCWVVANGRGFYEGVRYNPAAMPKQISQWCEPLLYVTSQAWSQKTGNDPEDWDYIPEVSYETGSNKANWSD